MRDIDKIYIKILIIIVIAITVFLMGYKESNENNYASLYYFKKDLLEKKGDYTLDLRIEILSFKYEAQYLNDSYEYEKIILKKLEEIMKDNYVSNFELLEIVNFIDRLQEKKTKEKIKNYLKGLDDAKK